MTAKFKATSVQLPEELVEDLKAIAKAEGRSLASQIRIFLAASVTRKNTAPRKRSAA